MTVVHRFAWLYPDGRMPATYRTREAARRFAGLAAVEADWHRRFPEAFPVLVRNDADGAGWIVDDTAEPVADYLDREGGSMA